MLAVAIATAVCGLGVAAEPGARRTRVLSLHSLEPGVPADALFTAGLRAGLPLGSELALYSEHVQHFQLPGLPYDEGFRASLRAKYAATPPDVIVAVGADALAFLADRGRAPFPGVPVVFGMVPEGSEPRPLPPEFTGVTEYYAIRETLELALALFPDTEHVALVGGAATQDRPLNALLAREIAAAGRPLAVTPLFGLPMKDLQERLRVLPPRTVVFVLSFLHDGAGRQWAAPRSVPAIVSASNAPVFTSFAHLTGLGTIGGVQADFTESGKAVAGVALRIISGERPQDIPVLRSGANRTLLDARQLDRWNVPAARVPTVAEVRFREPSAWERYRSEIVVAGVGFLVQSALIALLLLERRRRWRAEAKARENLAIIARMNRVSAAGELVGSLAHEINSPLGAVLNNAEAAQRFLEAARCVPESPEACGEVRSCLEDIVRDVTRAGAVIQRIRGTLRRETLSPAPLDLGEVIRDALHLVRAEARDRGVSLDVQVAPALPRVTGDEVQLVQVLVNLLVNALDAVARVPEPRRRIRIAAEEADGDVVVRVVDSGPGVPGALVERVFEPFFTTKPVGLGMGLAITRTIVEAHAGAITVAQAPGGGAAFEVRLPSLGRAHVRRPARRPA